MALVWVHYAFVELFLYLPLLSGAFLAYAQVWATDPMPAAFWWRDIGSALGKAITNQTQATNSFSENSPNTCCVFYGVYSHLMMTELSLRAVSVRA